MESRDKLRITFDQNPAVQEAFRNAREGEKVECEIKGTIKTIDAEGVDIVVDVVIPEGYEEVDDKSDNPSEFSGGRSINPTDPIPSLAAATLKKKTQ